MDCRRDDLQAFISLVERAPGAAKVLLSALLLTENFHKAE
jgi:hypothetical protein